MTAIDLGIEGIGEATRVGEGGFGIVYRARQEAFGRTVAVKVLRAPALDDEARRRFDHECQAIGSMSRHPHIVAVYTAGTSAFGQPYLIMEYLPRGTLAERLARDGTLPPDEVIEIGIKLADALAAAHDAGVLHRDLKPENVLVSAYGEPQLVDFGVARIQGGTATRSGIITGTLAHAAPEVLSGQRASAASDVYSLASTLYALLAGHAPFVRPGEETFHPLLARVLAEDAPDLRPAGIAPALCDALERTLVKDPALRTPSARALAEALEMARGPAGIRPAHRVSPVPPAGPAAAGPAGAAAAGPETVMVSGAWARPPAPPVPPPPAGGGLLERVGAQGKAGLVGGVAVVAVLVVLVAFVLIRPGGDSGVTQLSSSPGGASTTTTAEGLESGATPPDSLVDDDPALPDGPAVTAAPAPAPTPPPVPVRPTTPAARQPQAVPPPGPAPTTRTPSQPVDTLDYPLCVDDEFDVAWEHDASYTIPMTQQTCVERVGGGKYKASMTLHETDKTSDDGVTATYRVELRACEGGRLLSSTPAGNGTGTTGGGGPELYASTEEFDLAVYAVAQVASTSLVTADSAGGSNLWSGDGLEQSARQACP